MCYLHSEPSTFASFSRQVPSLWATRRRLVIGGCFSRRQSVWWPIRQFGKCFAWSADLAGGPLTGRVDKGRANCLDLHKMQSPKKLQFQFYLVVVIVGREEGGHFDQVGHGVELGSFADCVIQFVQSLVASRGGQFPLGRSSFLVACFPLGALPVTTQKSTFQWRPLWINNIFPCPNHVTGGQSISLANASTTFGWNGGQFGELQRRAGHDDVRIRTFLRLVNEQQ